MTLLTLLPLVLAGCFQPKDNSDDSDNADIAETAATEVTGSTDDTCPAGTESCPCSPGGECEPGLSCLSNVCVDPGTDTTSDTETGADTSDTSSTTGGELTPCDPLLQDCPEGELCTWFPDPSAFACANTSEDIPLGEPCGYINDCAAGLWCAPTDMLPVCNGGSCCASYCDTSDPSCAVAGTECVPWYPEGMAPPGYESVGLCQLPG